MPMGLLGLIAIPFGFDGVFWRLMGEGIDWMIAVALFVAHLPGAVGRMAAFGVGPLLLGTGGLVVLCLLKTPLRWCGGVLIVHRQPLGGPRAVAGRAGFHRRPGAGGARRRRTACRSIAPAATPLPSRSGSPPTATRGCPTTRPWGRASAAIASGCIARLAGRQARLAGHRARRLRGGLPARGGRGHEPGAAGRMQGARGRPQGVARPVARLRFGGTAKASRSRRPGPPGQDRPWARGPAVPDETAAARPRGRSRAMRRRERRIWKPGD